MFRLFGFHKGAQTKKRVGLKAPLKTSPEGSFRMWVWTIGHLGPHCPGRHQLA